jgi:hypothetical protein
MVSVFGRKLIRPHKVNNLFRLSQGQKGVPVCGDDLSAEIKEMVGME